MRRRSWPGWLVLLAAVACAASSPLWLSVTESRAAPAGVEPARHAPATVSPAILRLRGLAAEPRARGVESLMAAVARRTAVETDLTKLSRLGPLDAALFEHPLVFLSGASDFEPLSETERDALRTYLSSGGMIIIDDASGRADSPFAIRARAEMSRILGGRAFETLPTEHALYRAFYLLDRGWGRVSVEPALSGIVMNRRVAVLFSANDLLGAWEKDEAGGWSRDVSPGGTRQREMALRLGVNLLLYSLTLDYKEDLVHLPLILERGR